jgi:tetratricopeptide (TPR) repeat protein
LAGLYIDWSKYDEAKPIYERALRIYEMVFGPNHPHYAQTLNSLAGLAQEQGRYDEAKQLYERTIEIKEKLLGPMHPELALTFNGTLHYKSKNGILIHFSRKYIIVLFSSKCLDLAVLYARQDRYSEAETFYKRFHYHIVSDCLLLQT